MTLEANGDVDDFTPPWDSFAGFFAARHDNAAFFLTGVWGGVAQDWSVEEWRGDCYATLSWLHARGLEPGAAVVTLLGNCAEALAITYACWIGGLTLVPLNPADSPARKNTIVRESGTKLVVYAREAARDIVDVVSGTAAMAIEVRGLVLDHMDRSASATPSGVDLRTPALRIYTSGTTGKPKAVELTSRNLLADCDALAQRLQWAGDTRIFTILPIHHVNGLIISSLLPWYAGWSTVLTPGFRARTFWQDFDQTGANVCSVVPTVLELLLRSNTEPARQPREFLCGAGPLMPATALLFEDTYKVPVRHLYGLSETTAVSCLVPRLPDSTRRRLHAEKGFPSVGPALDHVEVRVADPGDVALPAGERGEIQVRGAVVMNGYKDAPGDTDKAFRNGWFHTGDEGFWDLGPDRQPFFYVTGRLKEIIIRGGVNITPLEVDEVLAQFPGVDHALSFAFEHDVFGEEIAAYIVTRQDIDPAELAAHCLARLDVTRCPKLYVFGTEIPYTATGKAKRLQLRAELAETLQAYRSWRFSRDPAVVVAVRLDATEARLTS